MTFKFPVLMSTPDAMIVTTVNLRARNGVLQQLQDFEDRGFSGPVVFTRLPPECTKEKLVANALN